MLFETEKKAETFMKFNSSEIESEMGYRPERSYYCAYCGGWHLTSKRENLTVQSTTEKVLNLYEQEKERKRLKQEKIALLEAEKREKLKEKYVLIREYISILESTEKDTDYYREILNKALQEFELAENIGVIFAGSTKKRKRIEKALNRLGEIS